MEERSASRRKGAQVGVKFLRASQSLRRERLKHLSGYSQPVPGKIGMEIAGFRMNVWGGRSECDHRVHLRLNQLNLEQFPAVVVNIGGGNLAITNLGGVVIRYRWGGR